MKLANTRAMFALISIATVHIAYPAVQKIVAYKAKGMNLGQNSAIQIWQNTKKVSAATFATATNKKGNSLTPTSFFPAGAKSLFFDTESDVGIDYNYFGDDKEAGKFSTDSIFNSDDVRSQSYRVFKASEIPEGSKIKISIGDGNSSQKHPFKIEIEPRMVKVNVKKTDARTHGKKWKIYALKEPLGGANFNPNATKSYDSVTIAKDTTTRRLNIPKGLNFWILVPKGSGAQVETDKVTPMLAQQATSKINIDFDGTASWAN